MERQRRGSEHGRKGTRRVPAHRRGLVRKSRPDPLELVLRTQRDEMQAGQDSGCIISLVPLEGQPEGQLVLRKRMRRLRPSPLMIVYNCYIDSGSSGGDSGGGDSGGGDSGAGRRRRGQVFGRAVGKGQWVGQWSGGGTRGDWGHFTVGGGLQLLHGLYGRAGTAKGTLVGNTCSPGPGRGRSALACGRPAAAAGSKR